jgi:hypothetical protein
MFVGRLKRPSDGAHPPEFFMKVEPKIKSLDADVEEKF